MSQEFADQKLIVVGGTSGIGKSIAKLILQTGGSVVLIGKRRDKLQAATTELSSLGEVFGELADITNSAERKALIERLNIQHFEINNQIN